MSKIEVNELSVRSGTNITFNDTVKIDAIKGKTAAGSILVTGEGTNTTILQQGIAKLWINIDTSQASAVLTDSFNVSGITDNATGDITIAINTNMGNVTYAVTSHTGNAGQNVVTNRGQGGQGYTYQTTSTNRIGNRNTSDQNWNDNDVITLAFFGDLS